MKYLSLVISFLFSLMLFGQDQSIYFAEMPTLTPGSDRIIFSYDSDLWQVDSKGGVATRITALEGIETNPKVSPDGQWLAFNSDQYGNNDVYIMPIAGGEIKQLTYHEANDEVANWSWDSQIIYFSSNRYNRISTYTVKVTGGTPRRLFENYFNNIHNVAIHPKTGEVFFNESWESSLFTHRKRYKGPYNPDIKSYNFTTQELKQYTDYEGKDMWTTIDRNGNTYFVSDRDNGEYNLFKLVDNSTVRLTDHPTAIFNPSVAANGESIVYIRDYQIYLYDIEKGIDAKVDITLNEYQTLNKDQDFKVEANITAFDIADDGEKIVFVSRGELFVSDIKGKYVKQLKTAPLGRVLEAYWLKDNKQIIFNQTVNGFQNWFTIDPSTNAEELQITNDLRNNRNISFNKDKSKAVYISGRDELRMLTLDNFKSSLITKDELWGFYNDVPQWSPDDAYVMYTAYRDFEQDIMLVDMKDNKVTNLTMTGVSESAPVWSPDGKAIYFSSNRHQPSYPRGGDDNNIYKLPLQKITAPFKKDNYERLFDDKDYIAKKDSIDQIVQVTINFEEVMDRIEVVGPTFGNQSSPFVIQQKDKTIMLYSSDHERGDTKLWKTESQPFEANKTSVIEGPAVYSLNIESAKDEYYILTNGKIYHLNLSASKLDEISIKHTFQRKLREEFDQMFHETWANLDENFYADDMHGLNWSAMRDRYASFLPFVKNRANLRTLTNDLLGELNTSHFGFNSNGNEEEKTFANRTMELGLVFEEEHPFTIKSIIKNGPADAVNIDIIPGDEIISINNKSISAGDNRFQLFTAPSLPDELSLKIKRGSSLREVMIHPISYRTNTNLLYDEWIDVNQNRVDSKTNKQVAYVYMKNMTGGSLEGFLNEMVAEWYQRDALILDLRYNTGGNVHNDVLQFLSQQTYLQWKYRGGQLTPQPNFAPSLKPIVLLINEQSLSDAEMTTEGFKRLKLGTVVGTPTYRWIIFTSGKGLVDGSFYRLPSWGCYTLDGANLEKTGVEPDVYIHNTMKDRLLGKDPQLDKAIEIVMNQLLKK